MPIKGLSEVRRMPRIGKIRVGIKKKNAKGVEYPAQVDYFVFPEGYAEALKKAFGTDKPKSIPIQIPGEDEERWANQYYRQYSKTRGLVCKGDGEIATRLTDPATGDWDLSPESKDIGMKNWRCEGRKCRDYIGDKCKEVMMLQFVVDADIPGMGIWQLDTSSVNAILNINSAAEMIRWIYGKVSMVPLTLSLEPTMVKGPDQKQRSMPILFLRPREDSSISMGTLLERAKTLALTAGQPPVESEELPEVDEGYPELIARDAQAPAGQEPTPEIKSTALSTKVRKPRRKAADVQAAETKAPEIKIEPPGTEPEPEPEDPDWTELKSAGDEHRASDEHQEAVAKRNEPDKEAPVKNDSKPITGWQEFFDRAYRIQIAGGKDPKKVNTTGVCVDLAVKYMSDFAGTKEEALDKLAAKYKIADWRTL